MKGIVMDLVATRTYLSTKIAQKKAHIKNEMKRIKVLEDLLRECGGEVKDK